MLAGIVAGHYPRFNVVLGRRSLVILLLPLLLLVPLCTHQPFPASTVPMHHSIANSASSAILSAATHAAWLRSSTQNHRHARVREPKDVDVAKGKGSVLYYGPPRRH